MCYLGQIRIGSVAVLVALLLGSCATSTARPIRQGDIAPTVAMTTLAGEQIELSPRPGEMLWLSFWASWCHPCRAEWPGLNQAQQNLAGEGLRLVARAHTPLILKIDCPLVEPGQIIMYRMGCGERLLQTNDQRNADQHQGHPGVATGKAIEVPAGHERRNDMTQAVYVHDRCI